MQKYKEHVSNVEHLAKIWYQAQLIDANVQSISLSAHTHLCGGYMCANIIGHQGLINVCCKIQLNCHSDILELSAV